MVSKVDLVVALNEQQFHLTLNCKRHLDECNMLNIAHLTWR